MALVDYRRIHLDPKKSTVSLGKSGMVLGLGGIAKGYAVDRAAASLEASGLHNFVVSAGGDMLTRGTKGGSPWVVGIQHPRGTPGTLLARVASQNEAVATSGDYERFVKIAGKRYHHILDPSTGQSARDAMSVTILGPDATFTDGLSTSIFVLGPEAGLELINRLPGIDAIIIAADGELLYSADLIGLD